MDDEKSETDKMREDQNYVPWSLIVDLLCARVAVHRRQDLLIPALRRLTTADGTETIDQILEQIINPGTKSRGRELPEGPEVSGTVSRAKFY